MDKRKVIQAYRKGFLTVHECAQILGLDSAQTMGLIEGYNSRLRSEKAQKI